MRYTNSRGAAAIIASGAAGPIFVLFYCLFGYLHPAFQMPHLSTEEVERAPGIVIGIIAGGFIYSFAFTVIGTIIMAGASQVHAWASKHFAWVGVGAVAGAFIAMPFSFGDDGFDPMVVLLLTATGGVCAGICWRLMGWTDQPEPQEGE